MATINSFPLTTTPLATVFQSLNFALYKATSTTSLAIGTGSKVFTTQAGKDFAVGDFVIATSDADAANFMSGQVEAYSGTSLTIDVATIGGTGTLSDWTIRLSGPPGEQGEQGATGPAGDDGADGSYAPEGTPTSGNLVAFGTDPDAQLADTGIDPANVLVDADIGTNVQAYDADTAKLDVEDQTLTGGARVTSKSLGTITTGTVTPDPGDRPMQHYTNNGAHTLAPGNNKGAYYLDILNDSSAGALTLSGWTVSSGDAFTTTDTEKFRCYCSIGENGSSIHVEAFQ